MDQKGFTLIELIVIIVILGILAATAIPKYADMQRDARLASLDGLEGAIRGASSLVHARALLDGQDGTSAASTVTMEGATSVATIYSYARNSSIDDALGSYAGFELTTPGVDPGTPALFTLRTDCTISYAEPAAANGMPTITRVDTGC